MGQINLPNRITIARIVIIFIFLGLANIQPSPKISESFAYLAHVSAYILAIIAGLTDIVDGYIARKYNLVSDFGALMDPLADKIFMVATFIMMVEEKLMPAWIAVIVIAREFLVTGLRLLASSKGEVISADRWGKLKTFLQMMILLVGGASWIGLFKLADIKIFWTLSLWAMAAITVFSGMVYFLRHRSLYADKV